jgi:hypothetical protein
MLQNVSRKSGPLAKDEVAREYDAELSELTFNSKPMINALTIIAEENIAYAEEIVRVIENRIWNVGVLVCSVLKEFQLFFSRRLLRIFL